MFPFRLSRERMKIRLIAALLLAACCSIPGWPQDGAALYRSKCLACHGATGAGKAALKGTNLLADAVRNSSDVDLTEAIAQGGKKKLASHAYQAKGLKSAEIQALVKYVRTLQSKQKP
jgi:mono/diheme cytochrome c family protein